MSDEQAGRSQGETHGRQQEPVDAGERDTTQQEQHRQEGADNPAAARPDAEVEDSLRMAHSPDAAYGSQEGQAGGPDAGMPTTGGESQAPGDEFVPRDEAR